MVNKDKLQEFLVCLKSDRLRQLNFYLLLFLFCLIPVKNFYTDLEIFAGEPIVRSYSGDLPEVSLYPVNTTGEKVPKLTAQSFLVIDLDSKVIMAAKNPDQQLLPASTTKMMTALVAFDHYQLDQVIKVGQLRKIGQTIGLETDDQLKFESLLYGLLVQSGNDVAYVLADNYPGGLTAFIQAMNDKAKELHLNQTQFTNPAGIDNGNHFSTTHDLAVLASELMKNPLLKEIVGTKEITINDISGEEEYQLENINQLLGKVTGLKGIKTGWTSSAGECFIGYIERDGQEIITIVLASEDRFGETTKLVDWVFANFAWEQVLATLE